MNDASASTVIDRRASMGELVAAASHHADCGLLAKAQHDLRAALDYEPHNVDLLSNLAIVLVRRKQFGEAFDVLMSGLQGPKTETRHLRQVAIFCAVVDALEASTALLQRLIAQAPDDVEARYFHADVLARRGRLQEAEAALDQALDLGETAFGIEAALQPLWVLGRYDSLEQVLKRSPPEGDTPADFLIGTVQLRAGRTKEALASLTASISLAPFHAPSWFNCGLCHYILNNTPAAIESWKEAARLAPDNEHFITHVRNHWLEVAANDIVAGHYEQVIEHLELKVANDASLYNSVCSFFASCGLFEAVRALSSRFSSRAAGMPDTDQAFALSMSRCVAAEISSVAQLEYEIAEYGHLDVRKLPSQRTGFTEFLWRTPDQLAEEARALRRLASGYPESEEECLRFCRSQFQRGDLLAVLDATAEYLRKSPGVSQAVTLANAFAEYALGGRLVAQHRLNAIGASKSYIFGAYAPAAAAAVRAEPVSGTTRDAVRRITMDVWCSGVRHVVNQELVVPQPAMYWFDSPVLLNDHGTLLAADRIVVRETINCDPGRYIYGWPNLVHSAGDQVLIHRPAVSEHRISSSVVLAAHSRDQTSYAHWMLDILPKILVGSSDSRTRDMPILVTRDLTPWQFDVLSCCGVDPTRIVTIDVDAPVQLSQTVLPVMTRDLYPSPDAIRLVRSRIESRGHLKGLRRGRKLYIPRRANYRRVLNDQAIGDYLARLGFETVSPGEISIEEQMSTFSSADIVVAVGGAAVTNILYMPPGSTAVVMGPSTNYGTYFAHLANEIGVKYCGVVGSPTPDLVNSYVAWNFSVAVDDLDFALRSVCPQIFNQVH